MTYLMVFIQALRAWILHEDRVLTAGRSTPPDVARINPVMAAAFDALAAAYCGLSLLFGLPPIPDQLRSCGSVGEIIHTVTCQTKDCWAAFRRGVERRYPSLSYPTLLTEAGHTFESFAERLLFGVLQKLSGVTIKELHPWLGASSRRADFLLTAANGRSVYVEVTMLRGDPRSDNGCQTEYRCRLAAKLLTYAQLGLELPVIIGVDDLSPRGLEAKVAEILDRLALPVPPPRPAGWFEDEYEGGGW